MIGGRSMPEKCRRSSKPSCASMLFSLRCQQAASTRVDMLFFSASDFNRTQLGICGTLWRRFRKLFQKVQRRDQFVYCRQAPKPANTHHKDTRSSGYTVSSILGRLLTAPKIICDTKVSCRFHCHHNWALPFIVVKTESVERLWRQFHEKL